MGKSDYEWDARRRIVEKAMGLQDGTIKDDRQWKKAARELADLHRPKGPKDEA